MTHRADQVIDAVVSIISAAVAARVEKNRTIPFASESIEQDLPAISVRMGSDDPLIQNVSFIDSALSVNVVLIVSRETEPDVVADLMELRRATHVALMADQTLGKSFVSDTRYAGASAPEIDLSGKSPAGRMETLWLVPYRMNIADPQ